MSESTTIRIAEQTDLAAILYQWEQLKVELPSHHFQPFGKPVNDQQNAQLAEVLTRCHKRDDAVIFVAEAEQVFGTIALIENYQAGFEKPESAVLFNLWVEPHYRRRGVATRLYQQAKNWLEERSIKSIQVGWHPDNAASDRFWRKLGFKPYEVIGAVELSPASL